MIGTPIAPSVSLTIRLKAVFKNGTRLSVTYADCRDLTDALDRFDREVKGLGDYNVTRADFGLQGRTN